MTSRRDPATFSNYESILATHYSISWKVDFSQKILEGTVKISLKGVKDTNVVILDGRSLTIDKISSVSTGETLKHTVESTETLGDKITVTLAKILKKDEKLDLLVAYSTTPEARALQFLNKEQTSDRLGPYLFSQCQAIHARSILPCMDTPSVKATYDAKATVPEDLTCLMSAIGTNVTKPENGEHQFSFQQKVAVPTYLIAIVVGKLEKRDLSERCAVWCEPSIVDKAKWEFEDTEKFLKTAEEIAGKYVWGRYDLVVLPATFPFGGMENPCLTFVTPTLLAGDRSLVNVVAHEIAHSWTGNLVTSASWEHFWLNEGFTVFLERKIHGRVSGELERQFESERGFEEALVPTVNKVFGPQHEFTKLIQNQKNIDPDDAFSSVPYEKGSAFLLTIEQKLNNPARFEQFLREYIAKFAYKSVVTDDWKQELYRFYADKTTELDSINWDQWLNQPGLPPKPKYDTTLMQTCRALASDWLNAKNVSPTDPAPFQKMTSSQKVAVVDLIRANGKFDKERVPVITKLYGLEEAKNCEIRFSWLMLGLESQWEPVINPALAFALAVGRMKYCKPIYKQLFAWSKSRQAAVEQFKRNVPYMHPITATVIGKLLPK